MQSKPWVAELVKEAPIINPSLLAADFGNLQSELRRMEEAGAKVFHVDIMDGHFVPNLSIGVPVVQAIRRNTHLPLDVHLMLDNPGDYIEPFRKAGADSLLIHIEAVPEPTEILNQIRALGAAPGLVCNPATPVDRLLPWVELCDIVLLMSVNPGFGGQSFHSEVLEKAPILRERMRKDALLSIDGGVNEKTIHACAQAGVQLLVAGTSSFGADDYAQQLALLRDKALHG